jgi:hypothetical protein
LTAGAAAACGALSSQYPITVKVEARSEREMTVMADVQGRMEESLVDDPIEVMDKGGMNESYIPAVVDLWKESAISV